MKELTNDQAEILYKMYLRGLVTFNDIVDRICDSVMMHYYKALQ